MSAKKNKSYKFDGPVGSGGSGDVIIEGFGKYNCTHEEMTISQLIRLCSDIEFRLLEIKYNIRKLHYLANFVTVTCITITTMIVVKLFGAF